MTTLRIEHAITDYATWRTAFDSFAEARTRAGVQRYRVLRPVDDDRYICVDLDFATAEAAEAFRTFLRTTVWSDPGRAPALAGTPTARILAPAGDAG
ncbi:hypothetical protein ABZS66_31595 [Dactylosporangium sp. NPDC005572]|uniref:hypothetical protein n=1 Tax=Dactylosporangium sp. NPDC005572 TaxID=3156889 RepID=UPI0033BB1898